MNSSIRGFAKRLVRANPGIVRPLWAAAYPLFRKQERYAGTEYADRKSAFATIFRENRWLSDESISGPGSALSSTGMLVASLPALLTRYECQTLLDAPCGDFNWMRHVPLPPGTDYIGGDIVAELVEQLSETDGDAHRAFVHLDIAEDPLPRADLWLCRHVLFHLSNADIKATLANFAQSDIRYLLTENFEFVKTTLDISSGGFRFLNLRRAPFNLPKPIERLANSNPPEPPDYLCLWSREQVAAAVAGWAE